MRELRSRVFLLRDLLTALQTLIVQTWLVLLFVFSIYLWGIWEGRVNDNAVVEASRTMRKGIELGPDRNGDESMRWHVNRLGTGRAVWLENNDLLFWVEDSQVYAVNANAREVTTGTFNPPYTVTEDAIRSTAGRPSIFLYFISLIHEKQTHLIIAVGGYILFTGLVHVRIGGAKREKLQRVWTRQINTSTLPVNSEAERPNLR